MSSSAKIFRLKILSMKFVRTVSSVHIVIIPCITEFPSGKNLTVQAATVLLYCCTADTGDRQQTVIILKVHILLCSVIISY
jgi:hypothetical protein